MKGCKLLLDDDVRRDATLDMTPSTPGSHFPRTKTQPSSIPPLLLIATPTIKMDSRNREITRGHYVEIHGIEDGFEAAFSPGSISAACQWKTTFQRMSVTEPFIIQDHVKDPGVYHHRLIKEFKRAGEKSPIQTVDNGEFDACASLLLERSRRGGKTFMLKAVASTSAQRLFEQDRPTSTFVLKISLTDLSPFEGASETAVNAIFFLALRISFALHLKKFSIFRKSLQSVEHWLAENSVILLIDELNVIPTTCPQYNKMSGILDGFVGQKGCSLLYSTHHTIKDDLPQGCNFMQKSFSLCSPEYFLTEAAARQALLKRSRRYSVDQAFYRIDI
mgnify:CR=1 FL=1